MSNRKQYVKHNVNESGFKEIITGVLQGSILGSLLFSIYIKGRSIISNTLTKLNKVDVWLKHNKLSLNVEKLNA